MSKKKYLNQDFDGTEWCPHCNMETDFVINPTKQITFKCKNCGAEILPCSLCDGATAPCSAGIEKCKEYLCDVLWSWAKEN